MHFYHNIDQLELCIHFVNYEFTDSIESLEANYLHPLMLTTLEKWTIVRDFAPLSTMDVPTALSRWKQIVFL